MNNYSEIKMVIWDLDECFWKGTLSEGSVEFVEDYIGIVKRLVDDGVMNSICSKNDHDDVKRVLEEKGIWSYFIFPSIEWSPKGQRVKQMLKTMRLRAENVLFIDDNESNLNEVLYYNPNIKILNSENLSDLLEYVNQIESPRDVSHDRLNRYKILEVKEKDAESYGNNAEFLKQSEIRIYIDKYSSDVNRILELIERTNQLNYTKVRSSFAELKELLDNRKQYSTAAVYVWDKYGDYGLCGFYAVNMENNSLVHFLFSCRILGMGVEQYVYKKLGCPHIDVVGDIATELSDREVSWISEENARTENLQCVNDLSQERNVSAILLKGPCDMSAIPALLGGVKIDTEFNYPRPDGVIVAGHNHTVHIVEGMKHSEEVIKCMIQDLGFISFGDFESRIFGEDYKLVFYSLLADSHQGVYRNNSTGFMISFNSCNYSLCDESKWDMFIKGEYENNYLFTREELQKFSSEWTFIGTLSPEMVVDNLSFIRSHMDKNSILILVTGSEMESEQNSIEFENSAYHNKLVNDAVKLAFADDDNVRFIDVNEIINSQDDFNGCTNHYSRRVYYEIAQEISRYISEYNGIQSKTYKQGTLGWQMNRIKRKMEKFYSKKR